MILRNVFKFYKSATTARFSFKLEDLRYTKCKKLQCNKVDTIFEPLEPSSHFASNFDSSCTVVAHNHLSDKEKKKGNMAISKES